MSFSNVMRYSTRLTLARHGFETVTLKLAENYTVFRQPAQPPWHCHHRAAGGRGIGRRSAADDYSPVCSSGFWNTDQRTPKRSSTPTVTESLSTLNDTLNELDVILRDWPNHQADGPRRRRRYHRRARRPDRLNNSRYAGQGSKPANVGGYGVIRPARALRGTRAKPPYCATPVNSSNKGGLALALFFQQPLLSQDCWIHPLCRLNQIGQQRQLPEWPVPCNQSAQHRFAQI